MVKVNAKNLSVLVLLCVACSRGDSADRGKLVTDSAVAAPVTPTVAPVAAKGSAEYVGTKYSAPPASITVKGGSLLPSTSYALSHVGTPSGDMIWFDSLVTGGRIVRAAMPLPAVAKDERLFVSSCDLNGRLDPALFAIAVNQPAGTKFTKIREAWRIDTKTATFELLPIAGVTCEDPGG
jgi:hypothetical protein